MALRSTQYNSAASEMVFQEAEEVSSPFLCAACLGPNKLVQMTRRAAGATCKVCRRPCTMFSWRATQDARVRQTVLCYACASNDNLCQSCQRDVSTGLSKEKQKTLTAEQIEVARQRKRHRDAEGSTADVRRLEAATCTFFLKGQCKRGDKCRFSHNVDVGGEKEKENDGGEGEKEKVHEKKEE